MKSLIRSTAFLMAMAVGGCGGSSSSATPPIAFLYVIGQGSNSIIGLGEQSTGQLSSLPLAAFPTNPIPVAMVLTPSRNFVYVANSTSNTVSGFNLNHTTGDLTPIGTAVPPTPVGINPVGVAVDSKSQFLFVLNGGASTISAFSIDSARGLLTEISGSPFPAPANPQFIVASPTAAFLYVNSGLGTISAFAIGSNGALSPVAGSPFTAGTNVLGMAMDPKGQFLYAADKGNNSVVSLSIQSSGALTAVAGSPFPAGTQPVSVAVDSSGAFLYTANFGSGDTSAYKISSGALAQLTGSPYATGGTGAISPAQPSFVTVSFTNQFVFAANSGLRSVASFTRAQDGTLKAVTNSPFSQVVAPSWLLSAH